MNLVGKLKPELAIELLEIAVKNRDKEIVRCHEALRMWKRFWEDDTENEPLLAEEAMELTREILGDEE